MISAWAAAVVIVSFNKSGNSSLAGITFVMIGEALCIPLRPLQMVWLGLAVAAYCMLHPAGPHSILLLPLILLSAGISAARHAQLRSVYREREQEIRTAEALASAQLRAQLVETAMAIGKLVAALTHEINSPLGTLKSGLDSLLMVAGRVFTAPAAERDRLLEMQAQLQGSIQTSSERIQKVISRLQRFIDLEEAEVKEADINELIHDLIVRFEDQIGHAVALQVDLQPLPTMICRPQLLAAAFSELLSNAVEAVNGDGRVRISSGLQGENVEIRIEDNGRGMKPEEVENIFDPTFQVSGDRVRGSNWGLFYSRQIIFEHGGDIQVSSGLGQGTSFSIMLPYSASMPARLPV